MWVGLQTYKPGPGIGWLELFCQPEKGDMKRDNLKLKLELIVVKI